MRSLGRVVVALVTALAVVLLVGCSGPGADSGGAVGGADGGGAVPEPGDIGSPGGAPAEDEAGRQVVTTASATLTVEDPAEGAQRISELVEAADGRVEERSEYTASGQDGVEGTFADLVVRVPADALTDFLADLEGLGDLDSVSVSRSDVTTEVVDLDARISALQTSVARLQALMEGAATTEALLQAEQALSERQQELESLQSRRALLADQVELSTLTVHLAPLGVVPAGGPDGFVDGLGTGWRSLVAAMSGAAVGIGVLLPWLALAAVVTVLVLVPVRLSRRRGAGVAPAPTPPAPTPPAPPQG